MTLATRDCVDAYRPLGVRPYVKPASFAPTGRRACLMRRRCEAPTTSPLRRACVRLRAEVPADWCMLVEYFPIGVLPVSLRTGLGSQMISIKRTQD